MLIAGALYDLVALDSAIRVWVQLIFRVLTENNKLGSARNTNVHLQQNANRASCTRTHSS